MEDRIAGKQRVAPQSPEIRAIQKALRGPVAGVLADCVPQLAHVPHEHIYETIMDNPRLADTCFKLFRSERARFNDVIKRWDGAPAEDDSEVLSCGRTLADAVTLIVRAMAKRYFVTFDRSMSRSASAPPQSPPSAWTRAMAVLGLDPNQNDDGKPKLSRAEELFRAMREFLLYEWQVPLIPYYAPLPVRVARAAGPLLLLLREPAQIEALGELRLNKPKPAVAKRPDRKKVDLDESHPTFYLPPSPGRGR